MSNWAVNATFADSISIDDRAVQYGDGLFETIAIRSGEPRFWELHMERLALGCQRLGLPLPAETSLRRQLRDCLARLDVDPAYAIAKIIVTAGSGPRGYCRPQTVTPQVIVGAFQSRPRPVSSYRNGIAVAVCQTRLAQQPQLAGIKSLNRLEQVLGQSEWPDSSIDEGLMLDTDGRLICGTMSNVFLVSDSAVVTPAITRCGVSGIMRRKVLELLDTNDMTYEVRDVMADELDHCDELFLSNSQFGVLPVGSCQQRAWAVGENTRAIMKLVTNAGVLECRV